jgi:hypothetical protein
METFVLTMFWLNLFVGVCRLFNLTTGAYVTRPSIGVYAADTALTAGIVIWAGFALWYR